MKVPVSAYAHNLSLLPWQTFGTLTFRDLSPSDRLWTCAWLHFQRVAKTCALPYGRLLIALRYELGEQGHRPHFHYLLGGLPWRNHLAIAGMCENEWRSRTGSIAQVRPYDRNQSGAAYVAKNLGANNYERSKFDGADKVELSDAVFARMRRTRIAVQVASCEPAFARSDDASDCTGKQQGTKLLKPNAALMAPVA